MSVKLFFYFAIIFTALHTAGQKIEVKHQVAYDENSKTIYIGVENKFLIAGTFDQVKTEQDVKSYHLNNDTLLITPIRQGNMQFNFITKADTQQVVFTARRLPEPVISLGGANKSISKENCRKNSQLTLPGNDSFFAHFKVDSSVVTINGQTFICGDRLSSEALRAIEESKPGDKLDFTYVRAVESKSGLKIASQTSFLIK